MTCRDRAQSCGDSATKTARRRAGLGTNSRHGCQSASGGIRAAGFGENRCRAGKRLTPPTTARITVAPANPDWTPSASRVKLESVQSRKVELDYKPWTFQAHRIVRKNDSVADKVIFGVRSPTQHHGLVAVEHFNLIGHLRRSEVGGASDD